MRFPIFPSSARGLLARGAGPDDLVLWRPDHGAISHVCPGPVLAATYVVNFGEWWVVALVEVDGELRMHVDGESRHDLDLDRWPAPSNDDVRLDVGEVVRSDLSPLYLAMEEPGDSAVYFRTGETWRLLHKWGGRTYLRDSTAAVHQPAEHAFHMQLDGAGHMLFGPNGHMAAPAGGRRWRVSGYRLPEHVHITVPPPETVVGLTEVGGGPALLTRDGDTVRVRTPRGLRTVVQVSGPLVRHYHLPWLALQRSPDLIDVVDLASGKTCHTIRTAVPPR